jgi:hypothetical protein
MTKLTDAQRAAMDEYDRGEWPVRDYSIAITMRQRGHSDEEIRRVLGYVPRTDVSLTEVIAKGIDAIRHRF